MDENQNNDMNDVQGGEGFSEEKDGNVGLEKELQPEGISESSVLDAIPGISVRNIVVQGPAKQQDRASVVESVVETSTEVVDSIDEDTESYMEDEAV